MIGVNYYIDVTNNKAVMKDGKCIAYATSGGYAHYVKKSIEWAIHSVDGKLKGMTSEIPFIDKKKKTPSGKLA